MLTGGDRQGSRRVATPVTFHSQAGGGGANCSLVFSFFQIAYPFLKFSCFNRFSIILNHTR